MAVLGAAACSAYRGSSFTNPLLSAPFIYSDRGNHKLTKTFRCAFRCAVQALDALKVLPFLNPVLISGQEGIEKPAAAIYLRACEQAQVDPAEALHVGDELEA